MLSLQECYKVLGVKPNASAQEIRKAYLELVKRWHPDAHSHAQNSQAEAKNRFFQIQTAYEQIQAHHETASKSSSQGTSQATTEPPVETPKSTKQVSTELTAESLYESATALGKQGLYREAIAELSFAIRINPHFILAYQYRGHLNSLLGLENQAEADLNKAKALKRLGQSAVYKSQADIETLAREYPRAKQRSRFRRNRKRRPQGKSPQTWVVWSAIAAGIVLIGWLLLRSSTNQPQQFYPQPLNLESPALES